MITVSSLKHSAKSEDSYAYDNETLHVRLRTLRGEVDKVILWIGDPYNWAEGGLDGGNMAGTEAFGWIGGNEIEMEQEAVTEYHDHWFAVFKPQKRRCRYGFILFGKEGEKFLFGEKRCVDISTPECEERELSRLNNFFCFPYLNKIDVLNTPSWVKNTVWYQIFPDRFCNGRPEISPEGVEPWGSTPTSFNFMGGDLWGVIDKLDYLEDLGINGIYFCPIFTSASNHKYDTIDHFSVDPHLGGNIAFHTLIEEAHKRGIKIMLDAVFNHLGVDSPIWLDVVRNGANSRYADWFWIHKFHVYPDTPKSEWDFKNFNYETFGNVIEMPKLNTENEECREYLLSIVRYWTQNFDIDGWRLDVANEVDHHFWRDFRKVIKDIKPECYILGEIWHEGTPWLRGDQFDSLMNYPLTYGIIDYFALQDTTKQEFMTSVTRSYLCYPKNITEVMFNLLDSHDTARILSVCLNDKRKVKLAYLFMLTQAGSPCIYYGSEIGIDGFKSMTLENNRKCMIWDENKQDLELRQFIRWLIRLRKKHPQWCEASIQWKDVEHPTVIAYQRDNITFFLNNSEDTANFIYDGRSMEISGFSYEIEGLPAADLYDF